MLGYTLYPEYLNLVTKGQYYGEEYFWKYYLYIFLSFITYYLIFNFLYKSKKQLRIIKINFIKKSKSHILDIFLFFMICFIWLLFLLYNLIINYNELSYYNQFILKSNKAWFFLYSSIAILIYSILVKIDENSNDFSRIVYKIILIIATFIFFITSLKAGQRIQIFSLVLSILAYFAIKYNLKIKFRNLVKIQRISILIIIFVFISQVIRNTRGRIQSISEINFNLDWFISLFDLKTIIFQDYLVPSLSLMTSMKQNLIFPLEVVKSNLINAIIIFDYPTLGEIISRIVDPNGNSGFGYYYFTEGYNMMGFFGFFISPLTIVIVYYILEILLTKTNSISYNLSMSSILVYYIISVVRGSSLFFIKGIFFFVIPFTLLYLLATNKKIKFYYIKK
jgi:hypothetical protein